MKKNIVITLVFFTVFIFSSCNSISFNELESSDISKDILIMIDPGHGGPLSTQKGAKLATGGNEVTLNNSLSLIIANKLQSEGYNVQFTNDPHDENDFVSLSERSDYANSVMPDLFISIHHDANRDNSIKGFSIYYSSYRPGIETDGVYVLYKNKKYEYMGEKIINNRTHIYYKDNGETKELISGNDKYYVRDNTLCLQANESKEFAELLYYNLVGLDYMEPIRSTKEGTVMDNDLRVTRTTNMVSILVEAGFVSNEEEAISISKEENQEKFAERLLKAINVYFQ